MSPIGRGPIGERMTAVETHVGQLLEDGLRREEKLDEIRDQVRKLREAHDHQQAEMERYKGFLGGVVWVITAMGVAVYKFAAPMYAWVLKIKTGSP